MELKKSDLRARVAIAALTVGLLIGIHSHFTPEPTKSVSSADVQERAVNTPSGEDRLSPGGSNGLRPSPPGASLELKANPKVLQTAWTQSTVRLAYLERCEKSQKCSGFDNSKAYSYDLDVRRQTARELEDFTTIATAWQEARGGDLPEEAQAIARYYLKTGNDDVKEAALKLIEKAPLTQTNLRAALGAVEDSASGPLMDVLMKSKIVEAVNDPKNAPIFRSFIVHSLSQGGETLRKTFARNSLNVTTPETASVLAVLEKRESPRSLIREHLRLNREEFQRMQRGG